MADWKDTCNLPRTAFSMKANLQTTEPETVARWDAMDLYGQIRQARKGAKKFLLHDGPPYANGNIHIGHALNKILKDLVVKSHNMMGFDAPYIPGWDCHGLPIELRVDRELGPKKRQMSTADFRRECQAYAAKYLDIQRERVQAPRRDRRVGRTLQDDEPPATRRRSSARSASSSSRTWSTRARSRCTGARTAAPRWPKPKSSTSRTPRRRSTSSSR